jgi:hypothetical protein
MPSLTTLTYHKGCNLVPKRPKNLGEPKYPQDRYVSHQVEPEFGQLYHSDATSFPTGNGQRLQ